MSKPIQAIGLDFEEVRQIGQRCCYDGHGAASGNRWHVGQHGGRGDPNGLD